MNQNDPQRQLILEKAVKYSTLGYQRLFSIEQPHEYTEIKQKEQSAFEDSRVTKLIMGSHKLIENLRLQLMLVITILWFIEIDDEFFNDKTTSDLILWFTFSLNLILILFTYLSYVTLMNYWKATLLIPKDLSFYNSDQFKAFIFEIAHLLIFPTVFTRDTRMTFTHKGFSYYYTINEIIILIGTLRSFLVLQISLRLSELYNSQTQRLCLNYGITMKPAFLLKFMILSDPATLILTVFCYIQFIFFNTPFYKPVKQNQFPQANIQPYNLFTCDNNKTIQNKINKIFNKIDYKIIKKKQRGGQRILGFSENRILRFNNTGDIMLEVEGNGIYVLCRKQIL